MANRNLQDMLEQLGERRAALGRMVKEYNRLTTTNENSALTDQVSERIHETETEIEELFREARPAIDQTLNKKQKALRKLHQDRRKCTSAEKPAIDKRIKVKCKAIDRLTSASGMSSRTNVPWNNNQSPQMQGNVNSPSNLSPQMQGNVNSPSNLSRQQLNTIDDVLIECYLDDGTYWLSPVCINFTSSEGKTVHVCMSCMFFFLNEKKRYYDCSNEMHEACKGFGFFSRKDRIHTHSSECTAMKCDDCGADRFRCPGCFKYSCICTMGTFKCGAEGCGTLVCSSCSYCCPMCRPALIQTSIDCYFKCTK